MENEKNKVTEVTEVTELTELKDYLIENDFPQSFIDFIECYYRDNLLTIIER